MSVHTQKRGGGLDSRRLVRKPETQEKKMNRVGLIVLERLNCYWYTVGLQLAAGLVLLSSILEPRGSVLLTSQVPVLVPADFSKRQVI